MDTMTLDDVSKLLHITLDTARNRLSLGHPMPPSFRVGRRRLFLRSEVESWLRAQAACRGAGDRSASAKKGDTT